MANVLVVAPHPDDEVLGCGGTIARHAAAGDCVRIIVVTRGIAALCSEKDVTRVREEQCASSHILGAEGIEYLDFPAAALDTIPAYTIADAIKRAIDRSQPEVIYAPHWGDVHTDHKITYLATLVASRPCNQHKVHRLLCYETPSETEWGTPSATDAFLPSVFTDISTQLEKKVKAFECFHSQLREAPHPRSIANIRALAQVRGAVVCVPAAEAFVLVREINQSSSPW
jgi:LmbE family N-acetylglucosaminyl deacetylase